MSALGGTAARLSFEPWPATMTAVPALDPTPGPRTAEPAARARRSAREDDPERDALGEFTPEQLRILASLW